MVPDSLREVLTKRRYVLWIRRCSGETLVKGFGDRLTRGLESKDSANGQLGIEVEGSANGRLRTEVEDLANGRLRTEVKGFGKSAD